jgi:predicted phosphoribosyltransferase
MRDVVLAGAAHHGAEADDVICTMTPDPFLAVGHWYDDFTQTTDDEVHDLLARGANVSTR